MRVDDGRNAVVVHQRLAAVDALDHHDAFLDAFVRQHWPAHGVAHRVHAGGVGGAALVYAETAVLVYRNARIRSEQILDPGLSPDGDDQLVHGQAVVALRVRIGNLNAVGACLRGGDPRPEADVQALAGELAQGVAGDAPIHHRQEVRQRFQHHDCGTKPPPDAAQLQADHAGADHAEARRHGIEGQGAAGIDDRLAVAGRRRDVDGYGTGCEHDVRGLNLPRLAVPGRERDLPFGEQPAVAGEGVDAVAGEERSDAAGELAHHRILARDHARHVHFDAADVDAEGGELLARFGVLVRCVEQRLGGNAAPVQASAAECRLAVGGDGLVDAGRLHP